MARCDARPPFDRGDHRALPENMLELPFKTREGPACEEPGGGQLGHHPDVVAERDLAGRC